ncbi:MAG: peptidylprolyl isomerase [Candidatus Cloacimonadales bacterium]
MKKSVLFFTLIGLLLTTAISAEPVAQWSTSMGDFSVQLRGDLMPITVSNFLELTNDQFYDGLIFHRVIADFMIQDGCPNGTGTGGPGYTIPDEWNPLINFNQPGVLGMAKTAAPNSAGSQYFITVVPTTWLNEEYAAFGNVLEGMEVVNAISEVETDASDKPLVDVVIDSVRIVSPQIISQYPEESEVELSESVNGLFWVETYSAADQFSWWVNDEAQESEQFTLNYSFPANGEYQVKAVIEQNGYEEEVIWEVTVTALQSETDLVLENSLAQNIPNPFNPTTQINFNLAVAQEVSLNVYNSKGQLVKNLAQAQYSAGQHSVVWNGDDSHGSAVSSGIYFYILETDNFRQVRKAILLK